MARPATNLSSVKRKIRRTAAGALVALALWSQCAVNASAELDLPPLRVDNCTGREQPSPALNAWHIDRLDMDRVWPIATGEGVRVAVIDTGTSNAGSLFLPSDRVMAYDLMPFSEEDIIAIDCQHGTAVTAILAAGRNEDGTAIDPRSNFSGIAPDAEVLAFRTLGVSDGQSNADSPQTLKPAIDAFRAAIDADVDVINFSQIVGGRDTYFTEFQSVVEEALAKGIVVVAAAGNQEQAANFVGATYPAGFDGVISVGATNVLDEADSVTMPGQVIDIGAPGRDIVTLLPSTVINPTTENQPYDSSATGTSYAAPIVAGVVALMIENHRDTFPDAPDLTPAEIRERLITSADPPPSTVPNQLIGYGIVNPMRAINPPLPVPSASADETSSAGAIDPFRKPAATDPMPGRIALGMGVGAVLLTVLGFTAAIAIPAARRKG